MSNLNKQVPMPPLHDVAEALRRCGTFYGSLTWRCVNHIDFRKTSTKVIDCRVATIGVAAL